jgi:hypothetical protein
MPLPHINFLFWCVEYCITKEGIVMRVKLLISIAIASLFILVSALPAGAVEGETETSSTSVVIPTPLLVAPVSPSVVVPCIAFPASTSPIAEQCFANTITLGGPALQTEIKLFGPQVPSFAPPNFVLPILCPPKITPFECTAPVFDP